VITKTARLCAFMRAGQWDKALALAARFRRLGPHKATIVRAHEAHHWPAVYRGLGYDPDTVIADGIRALMCLYPEVPRDRGSGAGG
jgi:hypothetical protein